MCRLPARPPAAKALDMFLHSLVEGAVAVAESRGARTLTCAHMCVEQGQGLAALHTLQRGTFPCCGASPRLLRAERLGTR